MTYQEQTDILVLDASTGLLQKTLKTPDSVAQSLGVSDLLWSPDGKFLASAFEDNVINVWSMDNKSLEAPLSLSLPNSLPSLAWNPDSRTLISVSGIAEKRKVSVWDVIRGKQKSVLDTQGTQIVSAMWSPNGKLLMLYTKEGIIQIWDAQTQKTIKTFPSLVSNDTLPWGILSWHPDSNRIAGISCDRVSGKCVLWMWNLTSNEVVTPFEQVSIISTINEMVWSPDGKKLASSDGYKTVYIWDISGKLLSTLIGNLDTIKAISWNSDSNRLVTGSMDGSIRIWELR